MNQAEGGIHSVPGKTNTQSREKSRVPRISAEINSFNGSGCCASRLPYNFPVFEHGWHLLLFGLMSTAPQTVLELVNLPQYIMPTR